MNSQNKTNQQLEKELQQLKQENKESSSIFKKSNIDFWLSAVVLVCASITVFIGLFVLISWVLGFNDVSSFGKKFIPMAEETALLFLVTGIALISILIKSKNRLLQYFIISSTVFIGIIALLTLFDSATAYRWNISDILGETNAVKAGIVTGKMSWITAFCFILVSVALLLLTSKAKKHSVVFSSLALFIAYIIVVGYSYGVPLLYGGTSIPMAWPTAIAFIFSSTGLIFAVGKDASPISYFTGNSTRARLLRNILPLVYLITVMHDFADALTNKVYNTVNSVTNSTIDIIVLIIVGIIISVKSKSIGNSIDKNISERKQAEEALRANEENLFTTLHSIGDGVISTDKNGLIVRMNPVAEKLCGWLLVEAAGLPLSEVFKIVNAETRETVANPVKKVLENGEIVGLANHTILISRHGIEYQIADSAAPIKTKEGEVNGVVLVFSDVTENYAAQKLIEENEDRFRSLLENLEAGIVVHAPDTSVMIINNKGAELLGLNKDRLKKQPANAFPWKLVTENNEPLGIEDYPVNQISNTKKPIKNRILGIQHPDNRIVWVTINGFPALNSTGDITEIVISLIDITDRKLTEEALKDSKEQLVNFASNLQNISEEERINLAREIHDSLAQLLVALKIDMGLYKKKISGKIQPIDSEEVTSEIERFIFQVDNANKSARRIMNGLRPEQLELLGFVEAAEVHINDFKETHHINCVLTNEIQELVIDREPALALFRILQESLNNILKHSMANLITIKLANSNGKLLMEIVDNGIGFDENHKGRLDSYGIVGMKERVKLLGGNFEIKSKVGEGTRVRVEILCPSTYI
jgi:PAS domain S-box-containing protein